MLAALLTVFSINIATAFNPNGGTLSAVKIETPFGIGSGVDVGNGIVITANHVVKSRLTVNVLRQNGDKAIATVLWTDPKNDVAAISLPNGSGAASSLRCDYTPVAGDKIEIVGNPLGFFEFVHTWGRVARSGLVLNNEHLSSWPSLMLLDATATFGNSGGPIYDVRHRVIGILVSGIILQGAGTVAITFAVPSSVICKDMADHAPVS